jgi:ribosome-associated protein YbcJ (S4-like RNA binding protein)
MLDKFLTSENVKVNGEIAGRRVFRRKLSANLLKDPNSE